MPEIKKPKSVKEIVKPNHTDGYRRDLFAIYDLQKAVEGLDSVVESLEDRIHELENTIGELSKSIDLLADKLEKP